MDPRRRLTTPRDLTRPAKPVCDRLAAIAAGALLATFAAATPPATAASHRLSQGLPFSDVNGLAVSPDGQFAVYSHDAELDQARELWSVRIAGGAPVRLTNPLPGGVGVLAFRISADSQRVVYTVAQEIAGRIELYSIPIAGPEGAWTKLNGELPANGNVGEFRISPDSTRVVYFSRQQNIDQDAWTVPIDGGTPIRLRPLVTLAGSRVNYGQDTPLISPDSERVLFYANFSNLAYYDVWSAPVDGTGGIVRLTETTVANSGATLPSFSVDSSRVLYVFVQADGTRELYSAPSAGGGSVKLNGVLPPGGSVWFYTCSPDSSRVVYRADQQTFQVEELYSVPLAGGGAAKLNASLPPSGSVSEFRISPDSASVVYIADQDSSGVLELYRAPLAGGGTVKLNPTLASNRDITTLEIAPDGGRVVYLADQNHDEVKELFSVPLAGGTSDHLNDIPVSGGDVQDFTIAPLGGFVFYYGDILTDGLPEILRSRIAGSSSVDVRVSGPLVAGGAIDPWTWAALPDGRQVVYQADQEVNGRDDLYVGDICLLCDGFEAADSARWD